MKVTFTKVVYEDYEVDIPKQAMDEVYFDDFEQAVKEFKGSATKIGSEEVIEDVEAGKLDSRDEKYLNELDEIAEIDERLQLSDYYRDLM